MKKLNDRALCDIIKDKDIVEVMAGFGRHVKTYEKFNPKKIVLVDFNPLSM